MILVYEDFLAKKSSFLLAGFTVKSTFNLVALARLASYFFLRSQEKVTKKKATTCRFILNFESILSGSRKLANAQTAACRKLSRLIQN